MSVVTQEIFAVEEILKSKALLADKIAFVRSDPDDVVVLNLTVEKMIEILDMALRYEGLCK